MTPRALALTGLGVAAAGALLAFAVVIARSHAEAPARCASGLVALGPRCCGEGQALEGDRCTGAPTRCAAGMTATPRGCSARPQIVPIAGGTLRTGPGDWEAQGVVAAREVVVAPFKLDAHEVTEERWVGCVSAGACAAVPTSDEPGRSVAGMTASEARSFCLASGGDLPTSDQLAFAAAGEGGRRYPWGDTGAVCRRAAWGLRTGPCGAGATGPELAGSHPDGAAVPGLFDLAGNVAEWTLPAAGARATEVRGGSWADAASSALRSWSLREVPVDSRSPEIGLRCAYP